MTITARSTFWSFPRLRAITVARELMRHVVSAATAFSLAFAPTPAHAASNEKTSLPVVRDAEIEALIADYTKPILKVAGLSRAGIEVVLVNSPDFNAFVAGRRIVVNTGALIQTATPNELIGVLAHEIGHLAGGHQQRLREQLDRARTMAMVAGLLGAGVAIAGAAAGSSDSARAGAGLMAGGGGVAMRGLLSYQRSEEATADRSALIYLQKTGQSGKGLIDTFRTLDRNSLFSRGSSYLSSHPAPQDRVSALVSAARDSPYYNRSDLPTLQKRHDMARAKIAAYGGGATDVRRLFARAPRSKAALYGDAIATYLAGSTNSALSKMDALIASEPNNPWFQEMRGQILMDAGRAHDSATAFGKADKLDRSNSGILKAEIGQAMVTGGDASQMQKAVALIEAGLQSEPSNFTAYRFLAMGYGKLGDVGRAQLATAEGYWQSGSYGEAKVFALRARQSLRPGTPAARRAQDIIATSAR